jgi:hypothetical protein
MEVTMIQVKQLFLLFLASIFFVTAFTLTGCNKSDSNPVGGSASLDQLLVGVWWNSSRGSGVQIASDGTSLSLTSYAGKIAVDTSASAKLFTQKISASGGTGTYTQTGKWPPTGKDTTITGSFTYVLSNSNNTLSVTEKEDSVMVTTVYAKKNIGDAVSGGGTTSNTVSITFDGTLYSFSSVTVEARHDSLIISAVNSSGSFCEITVLNQVGTQTVGTSLASVIFAPNSSTYYGSSAGTIMVATVSGTNTQGTFSVTMINPSSPTVTKSATGSFNVTR